MGIKICSFCIQSVLRSIRKTLCDQFFPNSLVRSM